MADGTEVGKNMIMTLVNFIGETSTVLGKLDTIKNDKNEISFGCFLGDYYSKNFDMATWLHCCTLGKIVYIPETLNYFRIHGNQEQNSVSTQVIAINELYSFIEKSYTKKVFVENINEYTTALKQWFQAAQYVFDQIKNNIHNNDENELINNYNCVKNKLQYYKLIE